MRCSTAFVVRPQHHQRRSLNRIYYGNDEEDLSVHEQVWHTDPEWYEQYVVRMLGKDYCDSKWPINPERISALMQEKEEVELPLDTINKDEEPIIVEAVEDTTNPENRRPWDEAVVMLDDDNNDDDESVDEKNETSKSDVSIDKHRARTKPKIISQSASNESSSSPGSTTEATTTTTAENIRLATSTTLETNETKRDAEISEEMNDSINEVETITSTVATTSKSSQSAPAVNTVKNKTSLESTLDIKALVEEEIEHKEEDTDRSPTNGNVASKDIETLLGVDTRSSQSVPNVTNPSLEVTDDTDDVDEDIQSKDEKSEIVETDSKIALKESGTSIVEDDDQVLSKESASLPEKLDLEQGIRSEKELVFSTKQEEDVKGKRGDKVDKIQSSNTTAASEPVLLYRNMRNSLAIVSAANLTKLGYSSTEVASLQSDALAVIVADEVPRPRMGVPPQWKKGKDDDSGYPLMVKSLQEGEMLIQTELQEQQQVKKSEPAKRRPSRNVEGDQRSERKIESKKRRGPPMESADGRDAKEPVLRREARRQVAEEDAEVRNVSATRRGNSGSSLEDPAEAGRPSRRNDRQRGSKGPAGGLESDNSRRKPTRAQGKSRRIYDARKPLKQRPPPPTKPDPPTPNYWPDMDTFRNLLRSEAELRLRILGEDWEDTVKEESNWRLNLYKEWLWTLHNGVGDSIVPPSRYERARKTKIQPRRNDEREDMFPSERNRRSRRSPGGSRRSE